MEEETPQDLDENRIDLSQFDAITPGNWEVIETPNGGIHIGVRLGNNAHRHIITFTESLGDQVKKIERDVADMNAIAAVPRLIAELKRCYKLLDDADYARSRYGEEEEHQDIDNVADAYEAVCLALDGRGRYC